MGAYLFLQPSKVVVPDLLGLSRPEAETLLSSLNLRAEIRLEASQGTAAKANQVFKQTPPAQTEVPPGSVVTLFVVDGAVGLELPDVVGKTRSEAEDTLLRAGFRVKFSESTSNTVEIGRVISQEPKAGPSSLQKGGEVTLVVSGGKGEQVVPDLRELDPNFARERLKELGLELVLKEVAQEGFRSGDPVKILRQEPKAGEKLPVGSRVTVFVPIPAPIVDSPNDPASNLSHAPRFEGLTIAQARQLAANEGVVMELAEAADESALITFQDPPPGDPLAEGNSSVLVRTASSAVVPGLTGLSEAQARTTLSKADLRIGTVKKSYGPVSGEVLGQRPSAGIEVLAGSTIDLVVADPSLSPDTARNLDPVPTPAFTPAPWVE